MNTSNTYIKKLITRHSSIQPSGVTQIMIDEKRVQLLKYREMRAINYDLKDDRKYCWRCETLYLNRYESFDNVHSTYDKLSSVCKKCKKEKRKIDYFYRNVKNKRYS